MRRVMASQCKGKEFACQCRRHRFHPLVRKICWGRIQLSTPVFQTGKSHEQRSLAGYSPQSHRVRHEEGLRCLQRVHVCPHGLEYKEGKTAVRHKVRKIARVQFLQGLECLAEKEYWDTVLLGLRNYQALASQISLTQCADKRLSLLSLLPHLGN